MENTSIVTTEQQTPNVMNNSVLLMRADIMEQLMNIANVMSEGVATVPKHLQGKPSDCLAIVMQSARWGMDPYAVGQKTHLVNGQLGYEAQLVNAVITSSSAVHGRFKYKYGGDWEKIVGKKDGRDESGLFICVGAILRGEQEITWGEPIYLADITTRNSPLWKTAPKQQIAYLAVKYWARLYCSEVIMGVYTPDEIEHRTEKEINPAPQRVNLSDLPTDAPETTVSAQESTSSLGSLADNFRDQIERADDVDKAKAIRADIETQKSALGTALFTELKNKAVKRYYLVNAKNQIEAEINSLPQPDEPNAVEKFAALEKSLAAAKRHLGDELHDQFAVTLCDMKPEYVY
ncbi:RecT family recombinase [Pectobacterium brasiliense]|uniref:RecT family recombinase n=1 Tax=Pectobacterium brasiliense TaxID=180957 RepID=A0AAW9HGB9_9GAMM|nr:RecT family recombinase [Pectobacterium brasiliense]MDY4380383.1 RecT family recombinase [Pectobacterium brasiliense]